MGGKKKRDRFGEVQEDVEILQGRVGELEGKLEDTARAVENLLQMVNQLIDDNDLQASDALDEYCDYVERMLGVSVTSYEAGQDRS